MIDERWKAELAILGGAYYDKQNSAYIFSELSADYFEEEPIGAAFTKLQRYWNEKHSNDFAPVVNLLSNQDKLVIDNTAMVYMPSLDIKAFIETFKKSILVDKAKAIATQMLSVESVEDIASLDAELQKTISGAIRNKPLSFAEYMAQFAYRMTTPIDMIRTGFGKFDNKLLIERGDFIILMGEQSAGKTALSINLAVNMAKQGYKVIYYSLETSDYGVLDRAISMTSGAKLRNIMRHDLSEDDMTRVGEIQDDITSLPLSVVEAAGWNATRIGNDAIANKADIIFIDYVGLVRGTGRSKYEETTNVSLELHTIAQKNKITIVALSQMNRESNNDKPNKNGKKVNTLPTMHDAKDTSQLESDADAMIALKRKDVGRERFEKTRWRTDAVIVKNKKGMLGNIGFWFDGETQRFTELSEREVEEENANRVVSVEYNNFRSSGE